MAYMTARQLSNRKLSAGAIPKGSAYRHAPMNSMINPETLSQIRGVRNLPGNKSQNFNVGKIRYSVPIYGVHNEDKMNCIQKPGRMDEADERPKQI